jgi:gamma-glutamylcyclotransferase (GGCT)/AIG2-like uncharacterized protein YtfP
MYYFAYGSNMSHDQMCNICPNAKFINKVWLAGYKFVYDGYSQTRKCPVANIILPDKDNDNDNDIVWGGLYEIDESCKDELDRREGYPCAYNRKQLIVKDNSGKEYKALAYLREALEQGQPSREYECIVIKGAKDCDLPNDYVIRNLKSAKV